MIPFSEWIKSMIPLLQDGCELKIMPKGTSMVPFVVGDRDEVILILPPENYKFKRRDIILYPDFDGTAVLHRIHHIDANGIYTLGDRQRKIAGPYKCDEITAIVKTIIRKGKVIDCSGFFYNVLSELWLWLTPFRNIIIEVYFNSRKLWRKR